MRYFSCAKCGKSYVYSGKKIPSTCGSFVGAAIRNGEMIPVGCGGSISEITEEQANALIRS